MYFLNLGGDTIGHIYIYNGTKSIPQSCPRRKYLPIEALVDNWIYSFCGPYVLRFYILRGTWFARLD